MALLNTPLHGQITPEWAERYASRIGTPQDAWALLPSEQTWAQYQQYLESKGYILRPRYKPGWVRSWQGTTLDPSLCEDSLRSMVPNVMDAVRASDQRIVMLKMLEVDNRNGRDELGILKYLASDQIQQNPRNHCVCAYDSFPVPDRPDQIFIVMPVLRRLEDVPFETVAEVVDFMHQLLEGLEFMHELNIAHRDCTHPNIMMQGDGLFDEEPHPSPFYSRTSIDGKRVVHPLSRAGKVIRYYFIDFGISAWFPDQQSRQKVTGVDGRERDVPELSSTIPYDPFMADICIIGRYFQKEIIPMSSYLAVFSPLVDQMTIEEPELRPTATDAHLKFQQITKAFSPGYLDRQLAPGLMRYIVYGLQDMLSNTLLRLSALFGPRTSRITL